MSRPMHCLALLALLLPTLLLAKGPAYDDPDKADADFPFQGEYIGTVRSDDGELKVGLQVIALGEGKFRAVGYHGGLPGDGWDGRPPHETDGELKDGAIKTGDGRTVGIIK